MPIVFGMGDHLGMCDHCGMYTYLDIMTIGGPSGDYELIAPMESAKWIEYRLVAVANSNFGDSRVQISGRGKPTTLAFDNTVTINKNDFIHGRVLYIPASSTLNGEAELWERVVSSQKKLFVRIDANGNGAAFVNVQFRARIIDVIPGPFPSVHPDLGHQMNIERTERVEKRLKQLGMPSEREVEKNG